MYYRLRATSISEWPAVRLSLTVFFHLSWNFRIWMTWNFIYRTITTFRRLKNPHNLSVCFDIKASRCRQIFADASMTSVNPTQSKFYNDRILGWNLTDVSASCMCAYKCLRVCLSVCLSAIHCLCSVDGGNQMLVASDHIIYVNHREVIRGQTQLIIIRLLGWSQC